MTELRVYYEDTDAGGVVYYASYLRFLERGRTEYLRERGVSLKDFQEKGYLFPVAHLEIDYLFPAAYDDLIRIETSVLEIGNASFTLGHRAVRVGDEKPLVESRVTLVCLGPQMKPRRLPVQFRQALLKTSAQD